MAGRIERLLLLHQTILELVRIATGQIREVERFLDRFCSIGIRDRYRAFVCAWIVFYHECSDRRARRPTIPCLAYVSEGWCGGQSCRSSGIIVNLLPGNSAL